MKDQEKYFVPYKHSEMMKELRFNQERDFAYYLKGEFIFRSIANKSFGELLSDIVTAPLYEQAEEWLWVEHEIFIETVDVSTTIDGDTTDEFQVTIKQGVESIDYFDHVSSPITAHREGILKAIEYLHEQIKKG